MKGCLVAYRDQAVSDVKGALRWAPLRLWHQDIRRRRSRRFMRVACFVRAIDPSDHCAVQNRPRFIPALDKPVTSPIYTARHETPSIETYRHLRAAAGMSPKTIDAAMRGLPQTLFAVQILFGKEPVGMGRVIGDGGCFYQVVDIAVRRSIRAKASASGSCARSRSISMRMCRRAATSA
jgi:hypothetical protein